MITVEFKDAEAQALADLISDLRTRLELTELVLGPIDWDAVRAASKKLAAAIDHARD